MASINTKFTGIILSAVFIFGAVPGYSETVGAVSVERSLVAQGATISRRKATGRVGFLGAPVGESLAVPGSTGSKTISGVALDALGAYGALFGLSDPSTELKQKTLTTDASGHSVVRYEQTHNGVPVLGGEIVVNLTPKGALTSINGEVSPLVPVSTQATIGAQEAIQAALSYAAKAHNLPSLLNLRVTKPVLAIYDPSLLSPDTSPVSLVWKMEVTGTDAHAVNDLVLVDAQRGYITLAFSQIDSAMNRLTYNSNETQFTQTTLVCDETDPTCNAGTIAGDTDAVNAHQFAKDTYDFYSVTHGRDSIDNAGKTLISNVHWNDGLGTCPNAFWNGVEMSYCTGTVADDVVAHELTHGVTSNTSRLYYYYQSGAINESLSDVWGEFVDLGNGLGTDTPAVRWLIGEDLAATGMTGAIRSMSDPTLFSHPDKMSSTHYLTGTTDNGGVHTNSGVNNKAAYLMVDGGTFNGLSVTGIGINKTAKIYYQAQTALLTTGADYLDLYNAVNQACQGLIGTAGITANDCVQVRAATEAVEMNGEPATNFNPEASMCPAGESVATTVFSDDLEGGLGNWTMTNSGGTPWIGYTSYFGQSYATSGVQSLYAFDTSTVSESIATMTSVVLPAGQSYLHFNHAYSFDAPSGNWDGGVLEYSVNGGTTWVDAGSLIDDGQAYGGTLSSAYSNPLGGRSAFTTLSHGYVSTRLNLLTLAGSTVQFRWRLGTDDSIGYLGWFLDDVNVYTCGTASTLNLTAATSTVNETGGSATVTVSRTGGSAGIVTVGYATAGGSATAGADFTAVAGTLTWADGDAANKTFSIPVAYNSTLYEGDETVNVVLYNPTGGAILGQTSLSTLTIVDNDPAPSVSFTGATFSANENAGTATITVQRSAVSVGAISVDYSVSEGAALPGLDYTATSGTLSWADGDSANKTFTIPVIDNADVDGNKTCTVHLSGPGAAVLSSPSTATLTIVDDEVSSGGGGGGGGLGLLFMAALLAGAGARRGRSVSA